MMTYGIADVGNACLRTMAKLDCSANNIANVSTPGFKTEFLNLFDERFRPLVERQGAFV